MLLLNASPNDPLDLGESTQLFNSVALLTKRLPLIFQVER